jgi:CRISPR-associated protein Cmr6
MAVITDSPPASSLAVKPDIITLYYRKSDVRETEAKPTPSSWGPGATFDFFTASRSVETRCAGEMYSLIKETLAEGLGAKTKLGYGIVKR